MTTRRAWKRGEQRVAEKLGTQRTPLSGEASRHTSSDTLHETVYVEYKLREDPPAWDRYLDARSTARRHDLEAVIHLDRGDRKPFRALAMVDLDVLLSDAQDVGLDGPYLHRFLEDASLYSVTDRFYIDHYLHGRAPYHDLAEDVVENAVEEDKEPLIVVHKAGSRLDVAVVPIGGWTGVTA